MLAGMPSGIGIDVIGDVHGELPALLALGRELGYRVDEGWTHPEGRLPVFLGDLVDRGGHSLEVAELVAGLVRRRRAHCIMGNHEYNLAAWRARLPGYERPKQSNWSTTEDVVRRPGRWNPVLDFLKTLPLGIELPGLRIIHACWHEPSLAQVEPVLRREVAPGRPGEDLYGMVERHMVLCSPFEAAPPVSETRLLRGLPGDTADKKAVIPHEDLMKGREVPAAAPFPDEDGTIRDTIREVWWRDAMATVRRDRAQVFGHHWNLPPCGSGLMAPPEPSGSPDLRAWARDLALGVPPTGRAPMVGEFACVDYHGVTRATGQACIGALRWPERELAWACAPKTCGGGGRE